MFAVASALSFSVWLASDFWIHTRFGLVDAHGEQVGRDFVNYWAGARLAIQGKAGAVYRINYFLAFERSLTAPNAEFKWYGYPPVAILLSLPFGLLSFLPGLILWTLSGWAILARMLRNRLGAVTSAIAVLSSPASFLNAYSGQNGAFSAAFLAGGIMALDRSPVLAGILFGLLSYKPHLGVLIPIALLAGKRWRAFFSAAATVILVTTLSLILFGDEPWRAFFANAHVHRTILEQTDVGWARIPTVYRAARLVGLPNGVSYIVQLISALVAAVIVAKVWRGPAATHLKGAVLLIATFLATPYAFDYDEVVLLFAAIWYWDHAAPLGWQPWEKYVLVALVTAPLLCLALPTFLSAAGPFFGHLQFGPIIFWGALLFAVRRASIGTNKKDPAPIGAGS